MTDPNDLDALERELTEHSSAATILGSLLGTSGTANALRKFGLAFAKAAKLVARLRAAEQERDALKASHLRVCAVRDTVTGKLMAAEAAGAAKDAEMALFHDAMREMDWKASCDRCPYCCPLVMCPAHSRLSEQAEALTAMTAERDALQARVQALEVELIEANGIACLAPLPEPTS